MIKRTDGEVKAYVDGYNACYDKFVEILLGRNGVNTAIRKMEMLKTAVNNALLSESSNLSAQESESSNLMSREWISCKEKLPEVMYGSGGECSADVLICVKDEDEEGTTITISTGFYGYYPESKTLRGWWSVYAYGCSQLDEKYEVIAWMPLPEPYKEEAE